MIEPLPLVSICCITYNHEPYIKNAIDGFLIQKTKYPIEIIIHDDCSTDNTAKIIIEYQKKHPELIKTILQKENQFSKGKTITSIVLPHISGKYIAFCEGDDYWTDPKKIDSQIDLLEKNIEIDICTHLAGKNAINAFENEQHEKFCINEVITKGFDIPTCSVVIRREALLQFTDFSKERPKLPYGDLYIKFFGALRGGGVRINKQMAFNRAYVPGSWSERYNTQPKFMMDQCSKKINTLPELNKISEFKFNQAFTTEIYRNIRNVLSHEKIDLKTKFAFLLKNIKIIKPMLVLRLTLSLTRSKIKKVSKKIKYY